MPIIFGGLFWVYFGYIWTYFGPFLDLFWTLVLVGSDAVFDWLSIVAALIWARYVVGHSLGSTLCNLLEGERITRQIDLFEGERITQGRCSADGNAP